MQLGQSERAETGMASPRATTAVGVAVGGWSVANEATDSMGVQIALRETTAFEGDPALIEPGIRVTVWYRSVATAALAFAALVASVVPASRAAALAPMIALRTD